MEEINIIRRELKKLSKKGIELDIVNDTVCLVDRKIQIKTITEYEKSTKKWNGMSKDRENYDICDESKYIVASF
jgi:hypothetical protein